MTVVTNLVQIHDERFVLVKLNTEKLGTMYGTIDYKELDDKGCMKRELNGLEMLLSQDIASAIDCRTMEVETRGMSDSERISYFKARMGVSK